MKKLSLIGVDSWDRPVYKDEGGQIWKDINCGNGTPYLHDSTSNDFDVEPGWPIEGDYEIVAAATKKDDDMRFAYMMLDRLRLDCECFFGGISNRSKTIDIAGTIAEMKRRWAEFADDEKPEWLPWEKILDYEKRMAGGV